MKESLIVQGLQCAECLDVIISRYRHDCHFCSCGKTMVDGGTDYLRSGYWRTPPINLKFKIIGITKSKFSWTENEHMGLIKMKRVLFSGCLYTLNQNGKVRRTAQTEA